MNIGLELKIDSDLIQKALRLFTKKKNLFKS